MKELCDYTEDEVKQHISSGLARPCMLTKWRIIQARKQGLKIAEIAADNNVCVLTVKRTIRKLL